MTQIVDIPLTIKQITSFLDDQFKCQQCSKSFKKKIKLQRHINQSHLNIKPFKCNQCSKEFKRSHHLQRHELSHSNLRSFKCQTCIASFNSKDHLLRHIKFMHLREYIKCDQCGLQFMKKRSFRKHQKQHEVKTKVDKIGKKITKEKILYICDVQGCQAPFSQYYSLRRHYNKIHKCEDINGDSKTNIQNKSIATDNINQIIQEIYVDC